MFTEKGCLLHAPFYLAYRRGESIPECSLHGGRGHCSPVFGGTRRGSERKLCGLHGEECSTPRNRQRKNWGY